MDDIPLGVRINDFRLKSGYNPSSRNGVIYNAWKPIFDDMVRAFVKDGFTTARIVDELGVSKMTILRHMPKLGFVWDVTNRRWVKGECK